MQDACRPGLTTFTTLKALSVARAGEHDLIALGIGAHRQMGGFLGSIFGRTLDAAASGA